MNQTYNELQIIVIDDGSTDETGDIVDHIALKDDRIEVLHVKNGGVSSARNRGLSLVKGSFITFVDADDLLTPNAIEYMVGHIGDSDLFAAKRVTAYQIDVQTNKTIESPQELLAYPDFIKRRIEDSPIFYGCYAKLYRKDKINGCLFPDGRKVHEDGFFIYSYLLNCTNIITSNAIVYCIRLNPKSATRSGWSDKYYDIVDLAEEEYRMVISKIPEYDEIGKNILVKAYMSMVDVLIQGPYHPCYQEARKYRKKILEMRKSFIPYGRRDKIRFYGITRLFNAYYFSNKFRRR